MFIDVSECGCKSGIRKKYEDKDNTVLVVKEPYGQFRVWYEEACNKREILKPSVMCLATATKTGVPSLRHMTCKEFNKEGFQFFTYKDSRKSKELEQNPKVAASFYWDYLNRSVRIEGYVKKILNPTTKMEEENPPNWEGYLIIPESVEFWQGQAVKFWSPVAQKIPERDVLHKGSDGWMYQHIISH